MFTKGVLGVTAMLSGRRVLGFLSITAEIPISRDLPYNVPIGVGVGDCNLGGY